MTLLYLIHDSQTTHHDFRTTMSSSYRLCPDRDCKEDRMTTQWSGFRGVLGLCAALGLIAGCMTQLEDAGDDGSPAATSAVQQDIGGGGGSNCSPPRDDCPTF